MAEARTVDIELAFHDGMGACLSHRGQGGTLAEAVNAACDAFGRWVLYQAVEVTVLHAAVDGVPLVPHALPGEIRALPDLDDAAAVAGLVGRYRLALDPEGEVAALVAEARDRGTREMHAFLGTFPCTRQVPWDSVEVHPFEGDPAGRA